MQAEAEPASAGVARRVAPGLRRRQRGRARTAGVDGSVEDVVFSHMRVTFMATRATCRKNDRIPCFEAMRIERGLRNGVRAACAWCVGAALFRLGPSIALPADASAFPISEKSF